MDWVFKILSGYKDYLAKFLLIILTIISLYPSEGKSVSFTSPTNLFPSGKKL